MYIDNPEFILTITKLAGCVKSKSKKARIEAQMLEKALLAIIGAKPNSVSTKETLIDDDNEIPTEEEKKVFEAENKAAGKNNKEAEDRKWLLDMVKSAWDNPANWTDSGMMVNCSGDRAFGDNLAGYLKENGVYFNELNISPGIASNGKGEQVNTWQLIFVK